MLPKNLSAFCCEALCYQSILAFVTCLWNDFHLCSSSIQAVNPHSDLCCGGTVVAPEHFVICTCKFLNFALLCVCASVGDPDQTVRSLALEGISSVLRRGDHETGAAS